MVLNQTPKFRQNIGFSFNRSATGTEISHAAFGHRQLNFCGGLQTKLNFQVIKEEKTLSKGSCINQYLCHLRPESVLLLLDGNTYVISIWIAQCGA
ncbi:hypothetical protein H6F56_16540 [Microcoleus sp. FACHB-672]|nr:hypothetical protein [Microcoleus sp. FACHB-672]